MREIMQQSVDTIIDKTLHKEVLDQQNYEKIKRVIDFSGSLLGLLILLPLFIIVMFLIKLEDPKGKVFFKQIRVGKNGDEFYMYKFRSMVHNAEEKLEELLKFNEVEGAMFKMKEDPRVTKIGKFMRRTSIDELPQFVNVLLGEMSLVGPRPPLPREVKQYNTHEKQRLLVTPGCTGLWQVSGRSNLSFNDMVNLDLTYIKDRSIKNDLIILIRTVGILFGSKNAF